MLVVYQKFYTPLDKFINKFRRKGFWLYTGLVTISLLYMFYELSRLPEIPPPPPLPEPRPRDPSKHKKKRVKKRERVTPQSAAGPQWW
ncbi:hypothetical protein I9W82_001930 [Candida metapsilosis]|uniref:Uncharacterized protein n=1 Tax=Candida metapsilosis TaxID=273372 RepID=A0A8H8DCM6_9ASCO|nr:hypothetical protein I9W82_001930 [Candida metapsilosis]